MTSRPDDQKAPAAANSALQPVPKLEADFYDWYARHESKVRAARRRCHELVFIGDSITHLFEGDPNVPGRGETVWQECYGERALNLGFGWDRTQNVLWRLDHGEFAGQQPRWTVLLIGTNNLTGTANARTNTPDEIAAGVGAVIARLRAEWTSGRILLLGLLPRSAPADPLRAAVGEVNRRLQALAPTWPGVEFLDFSARFLATDGTIPPELMADGVHPTTAGYRLWAKAIAPVIG